MQEAGELTLRHHDAGRELAEIEPEQFLDVDGDIRGPDRQHRAVPFEAGLASAGALPLL
jgi:hypothetical protein